MPQVNVAQLHDDNRVALSLAWIAGRDSGTEVRSDAAAAASLIGHLNLTHPNSIQVIGAYEAGMVAGFVERLFESRPAAVIVDAGATPPPALAAAPQRRRCRPIPANWRTPPDSPLSDPRQGSSRNSRDTSPRRSPRRSSATA